MPPLFLFFGILSVEFWQFSPSKRGILEGFFFWSGTSIYAGVVGCCFGVYSVYVILFDVIPFDYIFIWGLVYIWGLWYVLGFGFVLIWFWFLFFTALMFFLFSGVLIFLIFGWFLVVFLIFLRFFFARFYLVLLTKMGTIFKILLQFFFFRIYWRRFDEVTRKKSPPRVLRLWVWYLTGYAKV